MKFTPDALRHLADPETGTRAYEMTPERKAKWSKIAGDAIDFLKARTEGPLEAYAILQFMVNAMQEAYGIRGGIIMENDDRKV